MRCFFISDDPDVLTGMRLAGIDGVLASNQREVENAVNTAAYDPGVAILIVTQGCYALYRERLDELKLSAARPLVNILSDSHGRGGGTDYLMRLINEAIGIKF